MKYRSFGLEINSEDFDDYRSIVIISGVGNKEKALAYLKDVQADTRVAMSLRNVNYKSFLMTSENLLLFKSAKDINEYQKFYLLFYQE